METKELRTLEEVKIYSDPYRLQILQLMHKMNRPATVKEIADEIGDAPAKVHYHMKKLERIGMVSMVSTKEINGIIAKYYEPFAGMVQIKHATKEGHGEEPMIKELIRSETNKLLSTIFNQNKEHFFKQMEQSEPSAGNMITSTLYMTEEENKQFVLELDQLIEKYKRKRDEEDVHEYEFFTTMVQNKRK
ncbi:MULTISPECIES: winged helix-turn-helix domain-containing protein [Paenibacillus]|uniref:Helix-turn-helix domain-containing protein n=1 Tax=Paenibacillus campinasensis TaxID=66347 RepID=A0A268EPZ7_9BACL|nr:MULTISPECIES: helix-turn-helix domain-containing protein [Paenibacillus]MUG66633.1 helix-turn-helix domain-containing protein [Paenibacillus campinasensis]PAD75188.1 transcriptional regulator [Paenibacillus campinasensis]PAK50565.1 transcriptional regulator [Paenibacillus sp. 7541]